MTDNLPAKLSEAQILAPFNEGSPMQKLLGRVLEEVGGIEFIVDWAEEHPGEFMRMVMAANPPAPTGHPAQQSTGVHIHLPEGLGPGPLDVTPPPVSEQ